ncbi:MULTISPECIES: hypothetical protein [Alcaligenes]|uniref:hypothetical protein n=1 Tax=Alcaligenes TaxID=507 RepID=UPI002030802C|nr:MULTISPECIES: hypothetical protein [Alcaligenes]URW83910.1 hypothetical protein NBV64_06030 [Alcaligenes sp. DN25]WEA68748.1 hypothetical protein PWH35_06040 [Alcaligenes faecalis]
MPFLSEMLSNHNMKPVAEIRLDNLERLVSEAGTADALAERAGVSPVYLSQIRSRAIDVKTGRSRNLGSVAARKLEAGMGKPQGWMDRDNNVPGPGGPGWPFPNLDPADFEKLSDSQKSGIEDWVISQVRAFLEPAKIKSQNNKTAA